MRACKYWGVEDSHIMGYKNEKEKLKK